MGSVGGGSATSRVMWVRRKCVLLLGVMLTLWLAMAYPAQAQIPLRLWHSWQEDGETALNDWIAAYQQRVPTIAIQAEFVPAYEMRERFIATPNADRPDLIMIPSDDAGTLFANALIAPLDVRLNAEFRGQAAPVAWRTATYEGKTVGLPITLEGLALYYNRALVPEANVARTWDDLLTQASVAEGQIGLSMGVGFYPTAGIFFAYGGDLLDDRGLNRLTDETIVSRYLTRLKDLYDRAATVNPANSGTPTPAAPFAAPLLEPIQMGSSGVEFRLGRGLYLLDGTWHYADNRAALRDNFGVIGLPTIDGLAWRPLVRSTVLVVSASSRQIEAALSFGRFITNADQQRSAAQTAFFVPVNPQTVIEERGLALVSDSLWRDGVAILPRAEMVGYWRAMQQAIESVTRGGQAPRAAARDLITQIAAQ